MTLKRRAFSLIELSMAVLIIGIIISVIIQGGKLFDKMKLTSARGLSRISDAATITGMVLWMDATKEGVFKNINNSSDVLDGDQINYWLDANGQLISPLIFSQSTANCYPLYKENAINGLPSLYFDGASDGTGDWLETATDPRIEAPQDYTIFAVVTPFPGNSTSTAAIGILSKGHNSSFGVNNPPYYLSYSTIIFNYASGVTNSSNTGFAAQTGTNTGRLGAAAIVSATHNSVTTTNGIVVYANGRAGTPVTASAKVPAVGTNLSIGRQKVGSPTRHFKGYIGEIIMYNRVLTKEELQSVEKYLSKKWGIKLSY